MDSREQKRRAGIICLVLVAGTLAIFGRVAGFDFINYDDPDYVTENWHVRNGLTLEGVIWAFSTGYSSNWHPLTWLSHMVDCQFYGLNPTGHHLTNLLFHLANTLLIFGLLRKTTGALWRSGIVAALFAWHSLHVESVAWVAERKDVLSTFFWMLTMWAYVLYADEFKVQGSRFKVYYRLSLLFFALGLMSKPMLVTLPFVLLLLDFWPLKRTGWSEAREQSEKPVDIPRPSLNWAQLAREKAPFFFLAAVSSAVTFMVQRAGGAVAALETITPTQRAANALVAYVRYLRKMVWPNDLAVFYPYHTWPAWQVAGALLVIVVVSVIAILFARRAPYLFTGWFWFLGVLTPVIGLIQVGDQSMADRYSYVPLIGIFILLVWGAGDLASCWHWGVLTARLAGACALAACLIASFFQAARWQNSETLFRHAIAVTSKNATAYFNLAQALDAAGKSDEALALMKDSLQIEPRSPVALNGLGILYARRGQVAEAADYYNAALRFRPAFADAHYNLGNLLAAQGKLAEAADQYAESLRAKPDKVDAHQNLGVVLVRLGKPREAIDQFKAVLRLKPDSPEAQDQWAGALLLAGLTDEAIDHYIEAIRLNPGFAHAHTKLGLILAQQGKFSDAGALFQKVIALEPNNADAHYNLASVFYSQKRYDDAAREFSEAARLKPDDAVAQGRLAASLDRAGKFGPAIGAFQETLRLRPDWSEALNGLAYVLATCPKAEARDGAEAVKLAERACELTQRRDPRYLATLDMAYAEAGRFEDAIKTAQQVQELATSAGQTNAAATAAQRLELYRAGKPYHEP